MLYQRLGFALLAILLSVAGFARAQVRPAVDVGLVGLAGGTKLNTRTGNYQDAGTWPDLRFQFARLGLGVETDQGLGMVVGATLAEIRIYEGSFLPISAKVYWDYDPDEKWTRQTAYIFAAYQRNPWWGDFDPLHPYLEIGAGAAYTYYAVTPKIEVSVMPSLGPRISLLLGFDIGGTYVFGSREGGDDRLDGPLK